MSTKFYKDISSKTASVKADPNATPKIHKIGGMGPVSDQLGIARELHEAKELINVLNEENAQLKTSYGNALTIKISDLHPSPFQTRKLDTERVNELAEHLKINSLTTPIIVRSHKTKGNYEIIAGHHRVEAYKFLGRTEIEAVLKDISDDDARKKIFYDNLMAPSLPDFEKYKGFSELIRTHGLTQSQAADEAGVKRDTIALLMYFEKLPVTARIFLEENPETIGANTAKAIVLAKASEEKILEALQLILENKLDQTKIISFIKPAGNKSSNIAIENIAKIGDKEFCKLSTAKGKTYISFSKPSEAIEWHQKIFSFIKTELDSQLD